MTRTLRQNGVALLGEVHDNPVHHLLRAALFAQLAREPRPAVVFEHIRSDQQPVLDEVRAIVAQRPARMAAAEILRTLEWEKSGWPDKKLFEPLFAAVIDHALPIAAGDPPRGRTRDIARSGLAAVTAEQRARLRLDVPLPDRLSTALAAELKGSHCGLLPDVAIPGMALAQHYRDAHLADALLQARQQQGAAILLAGNGHVRSDRGVPFHLVQRVPDLKIVSVLLIEVEDGKTDPDAYVLRGPDGHPAADFIVFTPRAERPDPCEEMRKTHPGRR